jgi:hypothetical protein
VVCSDYHQIASFHPILNCGNLLKVDIQEIQVGGRTWAWKYVFSWNLKKNSRMARSLPHKIQNVGQSQYNIFAFYWSFQIGKNVNFLKKIVIKIYGFII